MKIWFYLSFMGRVTSPYSLDLCNKMADLSGGEWKFPYWRSSLNRCCGLVGML